MIRRLVLAASLALTSAPLPAQTPPATILAEPAPPVHPETGGASGHNLVWADQNVLAKADFWTLHSGDCTTDPVRIDVSVAPGGRGPTSGEVVGFIYDDGSGHTADLTVPTTTGETTDQVATAIGQKWLTERAVAAIFSATCPDGISVSGIPAQINTLPGSPMYFNQFWPEANTAHVTTISTGNTRVSVTFAGLAFAAQAKVAAGGANYRAGDTVSLPGGTVLRVSKTAEHGAVAEVAIENSRSVTPAQPNPVTQSTTSGNGAGARFTMSWGGSLMLENNPWMGLSRHIRGRLPLSGDLLGGWYVTGDDSETYNSTTGANVHYVAHFAKVWDPTRGAPKGEEQFVEASGSGLGYRGGRGAILYGSGYAQPAGGFVGDGWWNVAGGYAVNGDKTRPGANFLDRDGLTASHVTNDGCQDQRTNPSVNRNYSHRCVIDLTAAGVAGWTTVMTLTSPPGKGPGFSSVSATVNCDTSTIGGGTVYAEWMILVAPNGTTLTPISVRSGAKPCLFRLVGQPGGAISVQIASNDAAHRVDAGFAEITAFLGSETGGSANWATNP